jgi:hypothetical protein
MKNINSLAGYQSQFKNFLLTKGNAEADFLANNIKIPEIYKNIKQKDFIEKRLSVYRNNVLYSLSEALGSLYPVTKRLVGDDCFREVAKEYVLEHPPLDPVIAFYGEYFAEFIANLEGCQHLKYLHDIAQLEWYNHCSLHAADAEIFNPAMLTNMSEESLDDLKFTLHPSAALMKSAFPVDQIWEENQKPVVGTMNIDGSKDTYLLIYRKVLQVQVVNLQESVYYLLLALASGVTISEAWEYVKQQNGDYAIDDEEFSNILVYLLGLAIFVV